MALSAPRLYGLLSLLLLGACAASLAFASTSTGNAFGALEPWPIGGGPGDAGGAARAASLALALSLGWGVPGLSLALLTDARLRGGPLLGRAFGLGCGYVLLAGLGHAILTGHAPGRAALLLLLAVPPLAAALRPSRDEGRHVTLLAAVGAMALLLAVLWPKIQREGMNGDGTEAYELARSLSAHAAPYWDLERWDEPGRFGTPAVNPFLTNSYLGNAGMAILGRSEMAVRLPLLPALVIGLWLAAGRLARPGVSGWVYVAGIGALYLLWNAYYVGYEPAFTDLAEPAASDTMMTVLFLAGFGEVTSGSLALGVGFLTLSAFVLYSAPILATTALAALALAGEARGRRALRLWLATGAAVVPLVLLFGAVTGDLGDWFRQVRSEYWYDLVDQARRTPSLPLAGRLLLLTGGLPLVAVLRARRLSAASRALLVTGGVYLAIVLASSYKNLHYVAPLPFLLAPPALEAAGVRWRAAAIAVVGAALALSWPSPRDVHRETIDLGRLSCIDGLTYEEAALAGGVVYDAFERPSHGSRFAVGKHTFVRYALDLGGTPSCLFRLSPNTREGWKAVAGDRITLSVRDDAAYQRWRGFEPPVPTSWLFPRRAPDTP